MGGMNYENSENVIVQQIKGVLSVFEFLFFWAMEPKMNEHQGVFREEGPRRGHF